MSDEPIMAGEFARHTELLLHTMEQGFLNINTRLDKVNGRLDKHDGSISGLLSSGCGQLTAHRAALDTMNGGGEVGLSKRKQVGIAAGTGAGFVGVIEIVRAVVLHFWK
jgi:hypothetical protein